MNARANIGSMHVAWILFKMSWRRYINHWQRLQSGRSIISRRKVWMLPGMLRGSILSWIFPILLFLFFLFVGFNLASRTLLNIAHSITVATSSDGRVAIRPPSLVLSKDFESSQYPQGLMAKDLMRIVKTRAWLDTSQEPTFVKCIGLLMGLFVLSSVMITLGVANKNLGQMSRSLEWFYTLPISMRGYYLYNIIINSLHNPITWGFLFPLIFCTFIISTKAWVSLFLSFIATGYLSMLVAAVVMVMEIGMRKRLSPSSIKTFQAGFTILGILFPLSYVACGSSAKIADLFVRLAASLPNGILWQPLSLPAVLLDSHVSPLQFGSGLVLLLFWTLVALASVLVCEIMSRKGLVKPDSLLLLVREQRATTVTGGRWLEGVARKEVLYLVRDRNVMVQMFLIPLFAIAFFVIMTASLAVRADENFQHTSALVFCIVGYSMASKGMLILNHEKGTIWHLFVFPTSLLSIVLSKTIVWATLAFIYAAVILLCLAEIGHLHFESGIGSICIALYGVILFTFIAAALGILAFAGMRTVAFGHRLRFYVVYLYRLLVGIYAVSIYTSVYWTKLSLLIFFTAVSIALWKKIEGRLPFLLDTRT